MLAFFMSFVFIHILVCCVNDAIQIKLRLVYCRASHTDLNTGKVLLG